MRMAVLAIVLFVSYTYFYEGGGWNQNTRFDLSREIVVHRTLTIDDYGDNTGDKSRFGGHTYIDKAPGASLTAVPAVALVRRVLRSEHKPVDTPEAIGEMSYAATVVASAIPAVIAALVLFWISKRVLGASDTAAGLTAIAFGLGSPMWAYAIVFFGHALCAGCLLIALAAACALHTQGSVRRDIVLGVLVGLGGGWATVSEYPCIVPASLIAIFAAHGVCTSDRLRCTRVGLATMGSALACAGVLLVYNWMAFGHPLSVSYTHFDDPVVMKSGFFDITGPNLAVLPQLLFGRFRGLMPLAPVLFLAPIGVILISRREQTRWLGAIALTVTLLAILLNVSYLKWTGGWNYGPRHMVSSLGFVFLGVAPLWMRSGRLMRTVLALLILAGIANSLIAVSTTVQPPDAFLDPMRELWWPAFSLGMMSLNRQTFLDLRPAGGPSALLHQGGSRAAWNLGQKIGLTGHMSLMPLAAVWVAGLVIWALVRRTEVN